MALKIQEEGLKKCKIFVITFIEEKISSTYNRQGEFDMRIRARQPLVDVGESMDDPMLIAAIEESKK
jgi:hypothetical protein